MKKIPFYIVIILFGLFGCSSQKKLTSEAPFTVEGANCQEYAAGREEGGTGFTLKIPLKGELTSIDFQQVYFRGHAMQPELSTIDGESVLVCLYENIKPDGGKGLVMHADPREEVGNQPPAMLGEKEEFPFELNADEAVIGFSEIGKKKLNYYKITGIKEKIPVQYPSRPKN
ncbi:hypothetical protein [Muriicola soli]|uniref:Uncharacterized protein n=1 Tax=Muriicola soli TaxID=2507538 RepID=A0A411ECF8_9FLAO|nr:hypothetical protein [Muriicola soli]QBA65435.1 hypothetical protein EQY75_13370 [Muriicola soli]